MAKETGMKKCRNENVERTPEHLPWQADYHNPMGMQWE
jgi:hypothetical protein